MATDAADKQAQGITNFATGTTTGAGAAVDVTLGFKPRYVRIFNETDVILWEKFDGQVDANTVKQVTAGTTTKDTGSAIVIMGGNVDGDTYRGFQMSATLAASGKALVWVAFG